MSEQTRYFRSQVFTTDEEISEKEALSSGIYIAAHYENGRLNFAEVHVEGLHEVIYYEPLTATESLMHSHITKYGNVPFKVMRTISRDNGGKVREISHFDGTGKFLGVKREHLNQSGNPVLELHMGPARNLVTRIEYDYDANGTFIRAREFNPDGTLVHRYEPDV